MMGLAEIRAVNSEATRIARTLRKHPMVPTAKQRVVLATGNLDDAGVNIPNLGDYVPKGWEHMDTWFVDLTGVGTDGEPAMSFAQLARKMAEAPEGTGFALREHSQFQGWFGVYTRKAED